MLLSHIQLWLLLPRHFDLVNFFLIFFSVIGCQATFISYSQTADKPSTIKGQVSVISPYLLEPQHISSSGQMCPYPLAKVLPIITHRFKNRFIFLVWLHFVDWCNLPRIEILQREYRGWKHENLTHFCSKSDNKNRLEIVSKSWGKQSVLIFSLWVEISKFLVFRDFKLKNHFRKI